MNQSNGTNMAATVPVVADQNKPVELLEKLGYYCLGLMQLVDSTAYHEYYRESNQNIMHFKYASKDFAVKIALEPASNKYYVSFYSAGAWAPMPQTFADDRSAAEYCKVLIVSNSKTVVFTPYEAMDHATMSEVRSRESIENAKARGSSTTIQAEVPATTNASADEIVNQFREMWRSLVKTVRKAQSGSKEDIDKALEKLEKMVDEEAAKK